MNNGTHLGGVQTWFSNNAGNLSGLFPRGWSLGWYYKWPPSPKRGRRWRYSEFTNAASGPNCKLYSKSVKTGDGCKTFVPKFRFCLILVESMGLVYLYLPTNLPWKSTIHGSVNIPLPWLLWGMLVNLIRWVFLLQRLDFAVRSRLMTNTYRIWNI